MGKRTRDKSEDEIKRKIKRLEQELYRRIDTYPKNETHLDEIQSEPYDYEDEYEATNQQLESVVVVPTKTTPSQPPAPSPPRPEPEVTDELELLAPVAECSIPSEILAVLGEAKKSDEVFGKNIPSEVSERWGKILLEGLIKEQKAALLDKVLIPENFQLSKAPKLNPEVESVLNDSSRNRDKRHEKLQNQLGSSIANIAYLTSELISGDLSKIEIIKQLSEINQILLDLHYEETMNRRRLIIPLLDKSFLNIIKGVKRGKFIFGDNLSDNIKSTKSIEKSSLQIRKPNLAQTSTSVRRPAGTGNVQGNFRAPPRQPSGRGARSYPHQARYSQPSVQSGRRDQHAPPLIRRQPPMPPPLPNRSQDRRSRR